MSRIISYNRNGNNYSNRVKYNDYSKPLNQRGYEVISLHSWISSFRDQEEMREIFLNMDRAMKYIHDHGYCIGNFDPRKIEILNNSVDQIRFTDIVEMPNDYTMKRKVVKEDIYNSSFIQIGLYSKCLGYLQRDFLKQHFDEFTTFLPEGDVPYYRGVIDRGASVYFCEYAMEKVNRDLAALESELVGVSGNGISATPSKRFDDTGVNDKINASIYKQISGGIRDAAFVSFLVIPTIILMLGVIFAVVAWVMSLG